MSALNSALSKWLDILSSYGCELSFFMNPGASYEKIHEIENSIGFKFTDDLKDLYLWADGQKKYINREKMRIVYFDDGGADALYDVDPSPGKYFCPLFGGYMFDSLDDSLKSYVGWMEILSQLDDEEHNRELVTVRSGHLVQRLYINKGWFPISNNGGGDSYAIDFNPPVGGTYGQVIIIGPNEDERRVVASSITEFFQLASTCKKLDIELSGSRAQPVPLFMNFDMECW